LRDCLRAGRERRLTRSGEDQDAEQARDRQPKGDGGGKIPRGRHAALLSIRSVAAVRAIRSPRRAFGALEQIPYRD
jgi:hypothetical protein